VKPVVGVVGAGYVGLVVATCYAKMGYKVLLCEKELAKFDILQSGKVPFYEPMLQELFSQVFNKKLFITQSIKFFFQDNSVDFIFSCVPTPASSDGSADVSFVEDVCNSVSQFADKNVILICKSTLPPGCCQKLITDIPSNITFVYSPEFLRQGQAINDFLKPDRIVFGLENCNLNNDILKNRLSDLVHHFISLERILFTNFVSAELIKHASNAMLASRLTFMNQIFRFAQAFNVDMKTISFGVGLDHRIGLHYLEAGPGFGGSCLPKDLQALISTGLSLGIDVSFLKEIENFNASQLDWFFSCWKHKVGEIKGSVVAVKGISFKESTSDLRNSVQVELVKRIMAEGPANVLLMDQSLSEKELAQIRDGLGLPSSVYDDSDQEKTVLLFRSL